MVLNTRISQFKTAHRFSDHPIDYTMKNTLVHVHLGTCEKKIVSHGQQESHVAQTDVGDTSPNAPISLRKSRRVVTGINRISSFLSHCFSICHLEEGRNSRSRSRIVAASLILMFEWCFRLLDNFMCYLSKWWLTFVFAHKYNEISGINQSILYIEMYFQYMKYIFLF